MSKERVKSKLRKAGQRLRIGAKKAGKAAMNFDTAYANKVGESIDPHKQPFAEATRAVPLKDLFSKGTAETTAEKLVLGGMTAGVGAANIASRYALPAGGVTLAGKGLYDLATSFGSKADEPEETTLPMQ